MRLSRCWRALPCPSKEKWGLSNYENSLKHGRFCAWQRGHRERYIVAPPHRYAAFLRMGRGMRSPTGTLLALPVSARRVLSGGRVSRASAKVPQPHAAPGTASGAPTGRAVPTAFVDLRPQLRVRRDDQPCPAIRLCGMSQPQRRPAKRLFEEAEGVFEIEAAHTPPPDDVQVRGIRVMPPQPEDLWVMCLARLV